MIIVGLSFVGFSRRIAHAGSAYAYVGHTFGHRCGFIAGWTLLLTYVTYAGGVGALVGSFLQVAVQNFVSNLGSLSSSLVLERSSLLPTLPTETCGLPRG
jgi:amino acid transporter